MLNNAPENLKSDNTHFVPSREFNWPEDIGYYANLHDSYHCVNIYQDFVYGRTDR